MHVLLLFVLRHTTAKRLAARGDELIKFARCRLELFLKTEFGVYSRW